MKAFAVLLALASAHAHAQVRPCTASALSLTFDGENGQFDGMSHTGTLLVLRNITDNACTVPGRANLSFTDKAHKPVAFELEVPRFMHPGPVIVPIVIPGNAEVTASLRYVNGDPYGANHCIDTAYVSVALLGNETLSAPFVTHTCSAAGKPATYEMPLLRRDPVYKP